MENKYARSVDLDSPSKYKSPASAVSLPQGLIGLDPNYLSNYSLVSPQGNTSADFTSYPAQAACKAIGGRLPNMQEALALYNNKDSYGSSFKASSYWSGTEVDSGSAYGLNFGSATTSSYSKISDLEVRCVVGEPTVTIGAQTWMKYNSNNGVKIDRGNTQTNNGTVEKYCYNNSEGSCSSYGGLYQWDEMMQYSTTEGSQGICPTGFHLPSITEWKTMEMYLGMTQAQADASGYHGTDQGTQLKTGGTSGFNGLLGGYIYNSTFNNLGSGGFFRTSTQFDSLDAWREGLFSSDARVYRTHEAKTYGFSVRCLKN